jgi:hypothetical protein
MSVGWCYTVGAADFETPAGHQLLSPFLLRRVTEVNKKFQHADVSKSVDQTVTGLAGSYAEREHPCILWQEDYFVFYLSCL